MPRIGISTPQYPCQATINGVRVWAPKTPRVEDIVASRATFCSLAEEGAGREQLKRAQAAMKEEAEMTRRLWARREPLLRQESGARPELDGDATLRSLGFSAAVRCKVPH